MLILSLDQSYPVKGAPVLIGSYQTGEHKSITVHMDLLIPAGFNRQDLVSKNQQGEREYFASFITGWSDIQDHNGQVFPYSPENKTALLKNDAVIMGVFGVLTQIAMGQPLIKNS